MDVADIEIVVQYKASCDLCTLWQRFGRAARGADQKATVILLYEKKDRRVEKDKEGIGTETTKRKPDNQLTIEVPPPKRSKGSKKDAEKDAVATGVNATEDTAQIAEKKRTYMKADLEHIKRPGSSKRKEGGVPEGSPMFDFINPVESGPLQCRRKVLEVYFGNDKRCEYSPVL